MTPNDTFTAGAHDGEVPSPEYLHETIRRECNDEQNLISARIGWLMGHGPLELRGSSGPRPTVTTHSTS